MRSMPVILPAAPAVAGPCATPGDGGEVVIYSARHYGQEPAFDAFTKKTGIQIKMLNGDAGQMFERLRAEGDKTPADLLLTVDAGNLWNAVRAGLLAGVTSAEVSKNSPAHRHDPEGRWPPLTTRPRTTVHNARKARSRELPPY